MPRPWLPGARPLLGKVSDHEIARRFGVARTIVSKARRELHIAPAPRQDDRSWVAGIRLLLGKIPDRDVGKRVGRTADLVGTARRELGIARSWRRPTVRGKDKVPLTEALLRSPRTNAEIGRMTGISSSTIGNQRRTRGLRAPPRPMPRWHAKARPLLGKVTAVEIARAAGVSASSVADLRARLRIAAAPQRSRVGDRRPSGSALRRLRQILTGPDRVVLEGRFFARPPRSFAAIGRELGISKQAVAQREARIRHLLGR